MANRTFIPPDSYIKKMATKVLIWGLGSKLHYSDKYVILTFYIEGVLPNGTRTFN